MEKLFGRPSPLVLLLLSLLCAAACGDTERGRTGISTGSPCGENDTCEAGSVCFEKVCRALCERTTDCRDTLEQCDETGHVCLPLDTPPCTSRADCDEPPTCRLSGECTATGCVYESVAADGAACALPADTTTPTGVCDAGDCVAPDRGAPNGTSCTDNGDCFSNRCANSVCCATGATCCTTDAQCGTCMKCGTEGACIPQTVNEDLKNECDTDFGCGSGYCDGSGACHLEPSGRDCGVCRRCDGAGQCLTNSADHDDCGRCRKCNDGNCVDQASTEDLKNECDADAGCGTGNCKGADAECAFEPTATDCGVCRSCDGAGSCAANSDDHTDCSRCQKCSAGSCVDQTSAEDLKGECTPAAGCGSGNCSGSGGTCHFEVANTDCGTCRRCNGSGGCVPNSTDHTDCGTCEKCASGSCVAQTADEDLKSECAPVSTPNCSSYVCGWQSYYCVRCADASRNGNCSGSAGRCATGGEVCGGVGANTTATAPCNDLACRDTATSCVPGTPVTSNDSTAELCKPAGALCGCSTCTCTAAGSCFDSASCPVLYTWDGGDLAFEADIYPTGKLGLRIGTGFRKPYPQDNYLLRAAPGPVDGIIDLRLVEERHEANYMDEVRLYAVDVPADRRAVAETLSVFPSERLEPVDVLHTVALNMSNPFSMVHVETGADVSTTLSASDDDVLMLSEDNNASTWNTIELDLGDVSMAPQVKLVIDANTVFPSTPDGYANYRNLDPQGVATRFEVQDAEGNWMEVPLDVGVLPRPKEFGRLHVVDITGIFISSNAKVRLRYCMKVYVDAVWFDVTDDVPVAISEVPLLSATLGFHGPSAKTTTTDRYDFDYDIPGEDRTIALMPGNYTRYGDVTPLLDAVDDMFVIFGIGDEVQFQFEDPGAPPADHNRQFVLYSNGYYKAWKTVEISHTIDPMPFAAMSNFPYDEAVESYPDDLEHQQYLTEWNTRVVEP